MRIEQSSGLSDSEIERMRTEGEAHAEEDHRKRELADSRNRGDAMVYEMEKLLKEQGDKLSDADKQAVRSAMGKVNEKIQAMTRLQSNRRSTNWNKHRMRCQNTCTNMPDRRLSRRTSQRPKKRMS